MNGFPSTRTYPRTLHGANAAFPRSAEYGAAVHFPPRCIARFPWGLAIAFVAVVAACLVGLATQVMP